MRRTDSQTRDLRFVRLGYRVDTLGTIATFCTNTVTFLVTSPQAKVTMATVARKHRRAHGSPNVAEPLYSFRFVVAALVSFLGLVGVAVLYSSISHSRGNTQSKRFFTSPDEIPSSLIHKFDAVIVLGGGAPASLEEPPIFVQNRADDAATIVRKFEQMSAHSQTSLPVLCLSAGSAHMPQLLSPDGLPIWESTATAAYLAKRHQMTNNVYVETTSYDTITNAFFTRTTHTDVNGWRNLLLVTSEFHMPRTVAIFDWIFLKCSSGQHRGDRYILYYLSSPNIGLTTDAIEARTKREIESTRNVLENLSKKYTTLSEVWTFLNREHSFYTANSLIERARGSVKDPGASELVRQSYGLKVSQ